MKSECTRARHNLSEPPPVLVTQAPKCRTTITPPLIKRVGFIPIRSTRTDGHKEQYFEDKAEPRAALRLSSGLTRKRTLPTSAKLVALRIRGRQNCGPRRHRNDTKERVNGRHLLANARRTHVNQILRLSLR